MDSRSWLVLHIIGFVTWVGGLLGVGLLLAAARQDARVGGIARRAGRIPDLGATLAMIAGVVLALKGHLFSQPYFHIKLALVVVLLGIHGMMAVKAKKASRGDGSPATGLLLLLGLVSVGIIYVIMFRPFAA